jgi:hypothetical protein
MRAMILGLLLAAGAASAEPTAPPSGPAAPSSSATATAREVARVPRSVWSSGADDLQISPQSGLQCPAQLGGYRRSDVHAYDGAGLDIHCNYLAAGREITVYMTRLNGADLRAVYDGAKASLLKVGDRAHPRLLDEGERRDEGFTWMMALYGEDDDVHSSLWMAQMDGWMVQYRATYRGEDDAHMAAELSAFSRQVRASAGAHLDLCAKSTAETGKGRRVAGKDASADAMMSGILMAGAQAAVEDGKGKPVAPPTWCFDRVLDVGPHGFVEWRAVNADGGDGRAMHITPMTIGDPPVLEIALDPLAALIDAETGKSPRWTATMNRGSKTWVFAFYDGRPDPADAARLMDDILAGKVHALSSYDVDGRAITLSLPPK